MGAKSSKENNSSEASQKVDKQDKMDAPPLKPFSKKGSHNSRLRPDKVYRGDILPRRIGDIPGVAPSSSKLGALSDNDDSLIVSRNVALSGAITACEKLVVEGHVEASLESSLVIEIAKGGYFKGTAKVEMADISGYFEGDLVAQGVVNVRANGRINGSVRYGKIVIEAGGEVSGDMGALDDSTDGSKGKANRK